MRGVPALGSPPLPRLRRRVRRDGHLRQARLRRGRDGRDAARPSASRWPPRCSGCSSRSTGALAGLRALPRRDVLAAWGSAPSATARRRARTSPRSSGWTRRCCRCCSTPSRRWSPSPRSRSAASGASRRTAPRCALASRRPRARARRRRGGRARPARRRARRSARRSSTAPTSSSREGIAARVGPLGARHARVHRRGGDADGRRRSSPATCDPGAVSAAGFGWLAASRVVSTVAAVGLFFAGLRRVGPTAASILSTLEPVVDRRCWRSSCSASRSAPSSSPAARSCCWRCSWSARRSADRARHGSHRHRPRP